VVVVGGAPLGCHVLWRADRRTTTTTPMVTRSIGVTWTENGRTSVKSIVTGRVVRANTEGEKRVGVDQPGGEKGDLRRGYYSQVSWGKASGEEGQWLFGP
jgi:hypothetical protein